MKALAALGSSLLVVAVAAAVAVAGGRIGGDDVSTPGNDGPGQIAKIVSNVPTGKADARDAIDNPCTSSAPYVDMPGMTETFTIGGQAPLPVIVLFQAEWIDSDGDALIQLEIDGVGQSGPGASGPFIVHNGGGDEFASTNGFNFISDTLQPGVHTATIQWGSVDGTRICVDERSMVVLHK
jgi:hypothetical protein